MRCPASEKLEIIRLVERSHLPARRTLETLGILPSTFYRWYDRYQAGGPEALEDRSSAPRRVWSRSPPGFSYVWRLRATRNPFFDFEQILIALSFPQKFLAFRSRLIFFCRLKFSDNGLFQFVDGPM